MLISGSGTNLQALLDAQGSVLPGGSVVAVGSDRPDAYGLTRAEQRNVPTFVVSPKDFSDREAWNKALLEKVSEYRPDLIVCAGLMRILGKDFVTAWRNRIVNTHPALLPSFPGAHGVRDALAYGVKVTGVTVHLIDEGVDTGPILAQATVDVREDDNEDTLHERIKEVERDLLVTTVTRLVGSLWRVEGRLVKYEEQREVS